MRNKPRRAKENSRFRTSAVLLNNYGSDYCAHTVSWKLRFQLSSILMAGVFS